MKTIESGILESGQNQLLKRAGDLVRERISQKNIARVGGVLLGVPFILSSLGCFHLEKPQVSTSTANPQTSSQPFSPASCNPEEFVRINNYPTPVPLGGGNSPLSEEEVKEYSNMAAIRDREDNCLHPTDQQIAQVIVFNQKHSETGVVSPTPTPSLDTQLSAINARAKEATLEYQNPLTSEEKSDLQVFSLGLPRQIGIVSWDGNWKLIDGATGHAGNIQMQSLTKFDISGIEIPTKSSSGTKLTTAQMEIVLKKEAKGNMQAVNYFFTKLYPHLPNTLPQSEVAVIVDGLAVLTLSETEMNQVGLISKTTWDGNSSLTDEMLDAIIIFSDEGKINPGGMPYLEPKLKELIQSGVLK